MFTPRSFLSVFLELLACKSNCIYSPTSLVTSLCVHAKHKGRGRVTWVLNLGEVVKSVYYHGSPPVRL